MKLNLLIVLIVLVFTVTQAKKQKKWRPPLEFGPKTTSIYSSIQRSNRRKINVDLLDPNDDRTRPPRAKLSGTSYKPGTYNWYPNMDIPKYSYRFRIFNLTKDQAGSYVGMHYDYRKNYGPLYNTRFGGTYPPIPPLLGDPRQPRLSWYLKKYTPPTPPANYIDHIMDVIKDGQTRDKLYEKQLEPENKKRVSAEWFTVRPKNESNYYYPEEKVKPRFGDYGGIALEDAFPAYVPKEPYEVVMVPDRQPIYKRSVETSIGDLIKTVERDTHGNIINKDEPRGNDDDSNEEFSEDDVPPGKKLDKAPDQKRAKSESYSSNSYSYEQFDSRESIAVPFTAEKQFSSSSSSSSEETKSKKTKQSRKKRSEDKSDKVTSEYSEVPDPYSKSESFPAPLNTGESGWGAKPPASKSTESGSENSSEKKTGRKKRSEQSGYPDHPYPRMKIEDDSEKERVSSGLENESFPSASSNAHSSDMVLWDAMRNYSEEFKSISSTSELVSSGSLSKYNSESESESAEEDDTNKDPQNKKDDGKTSKSAKKNDGKTSKNAKRGDNKTSENFKKNDGKTSTKNSVNGNGKKGNVGMPARNSHALKFDDKTSKKEESKKESGSNYDSNDDNPWGDISYVEEVTVDPPHLRTFPPTFTEQYVAPLHHQPDDFWDEIYRPDGPDPTLYPWQEEEIRNQETTWLPPIITTRDPTSKPKFIYVTNEDTASDDDKILESSEQKDKELPKQHNLGLTKKQLQLRKILKIKNKAKHQHKLNSKFKLHGIAKSGIDVKGKDKGRKEKKKPKKKDKEKKNNPNNFSRPNPDHLKVQGKFENQPVIGDPLHGVPKKGNVIGDPYNDAHKGVNKIQDPYLNDPRKIHAAVKPFGLDQSLSNGINVKGKDKGRKEKKKPKKKDKEKKNNPNNFSRPNPDHLKVQGKLENQPVIGDPYSNAHKGVKKIQDPFNDPRKIYAAVTPFEPDYSFSESRPEGNYEWPSLIHPKLNPETAYDDEGFPIHESPDWTSPTTHKKDRIFGKERAKMANGVRGRGINMQQYMKKITEKGQPHPEMIHKGAKFQVTPDPHIPHPQQELVHNSNGIGHDIKDQLQVPKIKDMKMTKDFVAAHNIDNDKLRKIDLMQAGDKFQIKEVNHPVGAQPEVHIIDLLAGMDKGNTRARVKRRASVKGKDAPDSKYADKQKKQKEDEALNPLLYGNQNLFAVKKDSLHPNHEEDEINVKGKDKGRKEKKKPKKKDKEKKINPNNFSRPNPDHLKVKSKDAPDSKYAGQQKKQKEDEALNPLLYGNQNLFAVKYDSLHPNLEKTGKKKKKDEGLNPLLYGNQNLFSANHNDYIKLSDIHSPFAKPPYGIPIDSEIKVYRDMYEAPSPVFYKNLNDKYSRQEVILEKMNLLNALKEQRAKLRAAARLHAPDPNNYQHQIKKQDEVPDLSHLINKRDVAWAAERLNPMQYGQKVIPKPKHGKHYHRLQSGIKDLEWMPYIDMYLTRILTSNPRIAKKRLREYAKFMGRDARGFKKTLHFKYERMRRQKLNPRMALRRQEERKKLMQMNMFVPTTDSPDKNTDAPIRIRSQSEYNINSWMPYVKMNDAVLNAIKKNQGVHKAHKREVSDYLPNNQDAQQPYMETPGIRHKRATSEVLEHLNSLIG